MLRVTCINRIIPVYRFNGAQPHICENSSSPTTYNKFDLLFSICSFTKKCRKQHTDFIYFSKTKFSHFYQMENGFVNVNVNAFSRNEKEDTNRCGKRNRLR